MLGFRFSSYVPPQDTRSDFERLLDLFMELLTHTSGDVEETFRWMEELDDAHGIFKEDYTLEDFKKDLKKNGYLGDGSGKGKSKPTPKTEQLIRKKAFNQLFGQLKKGNSGNHRTTFTGPKGDEASGNFRNYQFGDGADQIHMTDSIRNAQINHGADQFNLTEKDLIVEEKEWKTGMSTALLIDLSHSMILYGEDRITPAKKVAMALAEFITTRYPKDHLDIIAFGNDAWEVSLKDLPYLQVGPFHTNTVAGLEMGMDLLRRRKTANKQIFMITDGKPTCIKENGQYYKNPNYGFDPKILNPTLNLGRACRKLNIPITTFMIAQDPYLIEFVEAFTEANNGKAFYASLDRLGEFVISDYEKNKRRKL